jgi:prophage DNA circulation protein
MQLPNATWRAQLVKGSFRGAYFHCESYGMESGRRIVMHQFPKKDLPYAEDMGHNAIGWAVRGYCITYPMDLTNDKTLLYQRDYRVARNALITALENGSAGWLQTPTIPGLWCLVQRYRISEEERLGGFCTFDMSFVEYGRQSFSLAPDTQGELLQLSSTVDQQIQQQLGAAQQVQDIRQRANSGEQPSSGPLPAGSGSGTDIGSSPMAVTSPQMALYARARPSR